MWVSNIHSFSVSSEQSVAIDSCTHIMGLISHSSSNNKVIPFQQHTGFQFLLSVAYAEYIGLKAPQLGCCLCHLCRGIPLNSFEVFPAGFCYLRKPWLISTRLWVFSGEANTGHRQRTLASTQSPLTLHLIPQLSRGKPEVVPLPHIN